ncbi:MAG: SpvB/TcaC N-terminal domain-containing protein [Pseudomonadota bacterium]
MIRVWIVALFSLLFLGTVQANADTLGDRANGPCIPDVRASQKGGSTQSDCPPINPPHGSIELSYQWLDSDTVRLEWTSDGTTEHGGEFDAEYNDKIFKVLRNGAEFSGLLSPSVVSYDTDSLVTGSNVFTVAGCNIDYSSQPQCYEYPASVEVFSHASITNVSAFRTAPTANEIAVTYGVSSGSSLGYTVHYEKCDIDGNGDSAGNCVTNQLFCLDEREGPVAGVDTPVEDNCVNSDAECCDAVEPLKRYRFTVDGPNADPVTSDVVVLMQSSNPPSNLRVSGGQSSTNNGSATLVWDAPTPVAPAQYRVYAAMVGLDDSEPNIVDLFHCANSASANESFVTTNQCELENLGNGKWFFAVEAENLYEGDVFPSGFSNTTSLTALAPAPDMTVVELTQGSGADEEKITLEWSHVGGTTERYQYQRLATANSTPLNANWSETGNSEPFGATLSFTESLVNSNAHHYVVRACNRFDDCGSPTAVASRTPTFLVPDSPVGLVNTSPGGSLNVSFDWSDVTGSDYFKATLVEFPSMGDLNIESTELSDSQWTPPSGVTHASSYTLAVVACNDLPITGDQCSEPSAVDVHVVGDVPDLFDVRIEYEGMHQGVEQVRYRWDYIDEADNGYVVSSRWISIDPDGSESAGALWSSFEFVCDDIPSNGEPDVDVGYLSGVKTCVDEGRRDRKYQVVVRAYYPGAYEQAQSPDTILLAPPSYPEDVSPIGFDTNSGDASVSWTASSGPVARYRVESRRKDIDGSAFTDYAPQACQPAGTAVVTSASCDVSGLEDGDWQFRITAENGPESDPAYAVSSLELGENEYHVRMLAPPGAPIFSGYTFSDISGDNTHTSGSYVVDWSAPVTGGRLVNYELREFHKPFGATQFSETDNSVSVLSLTQKAFAPDSRLDGHYYYEIRGINEVNAASENPALQTPEFKVVKAIAIPVGVVTDQQGVSTDASFGLSWNAIAEPPVAQGFDLDVRYQVFYCRADSIDAPCSGFQQIVRMDNSGTDRQIVASDLEGNGFYQFKVRAHYEGNVSALSSASESVEVLLPPEPATGLVAIQGSGEDEDTFMLSWQHASGTADRFELVYRANGESHSDYQGSVSLDSATVSTGANTFGLSVPLISLTNHSIHITACNEGSCGETVQIDKTPDHLSPDQPASFAATQASNSVEIDLTWTIDETLTDYLLLTLYKNGELAQDPLELDAISNLLTSVPGSGLYQFDLMACNRLLGESQCSVSATAELNVQVSEAWSAKGGSAVGAPGYDFRAPNHDPTVGALAGEGGADGGSAYYNIPITVVPGRSEMQPNVSLSYSSSGGNGLVGVGWSLSANQSISRCGSTVVHDGVMRSVQYEESDRLCLNGQRLLLETGSSAYGVGGATYRTEGNSLTRVEQLTGDIYARNDAGSSFLVRYKNGHIAHFGETDNARHAADGRTETMTWAISRQNDPSENAIHYVYDSTSYGKGEHLLSEIIYTGVGDNQGNRRVAFVYEDRSVTDVHSGYSAGGLTQLTQRLARVETHYGLSRQANTLVRSYTLNYGDTSQYSGRTLLRSVQECGHSDTGKSACRPATAFSWSESEIQYEFEQLSYTDTNNEHHWIGQNQFHIQDVIPHSDENGDGVADFEEAFINAEGHQIGVRTYQNLETCIQPIATFNIECFSGDFNNDGLTDHFFESDSTPGQVNITYSVPQVSNTTVPALGTVSTPVPIGSGKVTILSVQDFNADGWIDFAVRQDSETRSGQYDLVFYLHTGDPAIPYTTSNSQVALPFEYVSTNIFTGFTSTVSFVGDVNGDGTTDFLEFKANRSVNDAQSMRDTPENIHFVRPSVDGSIAISSTSFFDYAENGFDLPNLWPGGVAGFENSHIFMDANGDGLVDWLTIFGANPTSETHTSDQGTVRTYTSELRFRLNTGTSFKQGWQNLGIEIPVAMRFQPFANTDPGDGAPYFSAILSKTIIADYNGDGRTDILRAEDVVASGCSQFMAYGDDLSAELHEACDDALYSAVNFSPDNNNAAGSALPGSHKDVSLRRYRAFMLRPDQNGQVIVSDELTDIYASASHRVAADIFGDGLGDVLTTVGCDPSDTYCTLTDMPGVSPTDMAFDGSGAKVGAYISRNLGAARNGERYRKPDMMERVVDGLGMEYHWEYRPLSSGGIDGANSQAFYNTDHGYVNSGSIDGTDGDHHHFGSSYYVVAEHRSSHGGTFDHDSDGLYDEAPQSFDQSFNVYRYRYSGATFNKMGRGFLGFRSIVAEDISQGVKTRTIFDQKWPFTGNIVKTCSWENDESDAFETVLSGSGDNLVVSVTCSQTPFSEQTLTYERYSLVNGTDISVPIVKETITRDLNLRMVPMTTSTVLHEYYPDYGNLKKQTITVSDLGIGNYKTEEFHEYYPVDMAALWTDKLDQTTVTRFPVTNRAQLGDIVAANGLDTAPKVTTSSYQWHASHRKPVQVAITGGATTTTTYTDRGQAQSVTVAVNGNAAHNRTNTSRYHLDGYFPYETENALQHVTSIETDPRFGVPVRATDPNQITTATSLDLFGQAIYVEQTTATGSATLPGMHTALSWCADETDACPAGGVIRSRQASAGTPLVMVDTDLAGRTIRSWKEGPSNHVLAGDVVQIMQYDRNGYTRFESIPHYEGSLQASIGTRYNDYDTLGRLLSKSVDQATAGQFTTAYNYVFFRTDITADTLSLSRVYDSQKRLVSARDAIDGYTRYAYDGSGNPIVIQDANLNAIVANHDDLNRKVYVDDPNAGRTDFAYNLAGELISKTDADGYIVESSHDLLGRVIERHVLDPTHTSPELRLDAKWLYDSLGGHAFFGAVFEEQKYQGEAITPVMSKRFFYDEFGRTTDTYHTIHGATYHVGTAYDPVYGRELSVRYPNGLTVASEYTDNGYPLRDINVATGYVYRQFDMVDQHGNPTSTMLADGVIVESAGFHANTGQMAFINASANGQTRHHIDYNEYDIFGNVTTQTKHFPGEEATETFGYDDLHRLTSSTRTISTSNGDDGGSNVLVNYDYDAVGNIVQKSDFGSLYTYGDLNAGDNCHAGPNAVSRIDKTNGSTAFYCYDRRGNQTSGDGRDVSYNAFNHPTNISNSSTNTSSYFEYGANLQRYVQVLTQGATTTYTYYVDKLSEIKQTGDEVEFRNYIADYAIVTEKLTGQITAEGLQNLTTLSNKISFLHKDRLGSVSTVLDEVGEIAERRSFDPFGKPREGSWQDKISPVIESPLTNRGFTGHEHLDGVELIHMNGRIYDYQSGRFLSVDPIIQAPTNSQSMNPYSYIMNNPLAGIDPTGYSAEDVPNGARNMTVTVSTSKKVYKTGSRIAKGEISTTLTVEVTPDGKGTVIEVNRTITKAGKEVVNMTREVSQETNGGRSANSTGGAEPSVMTTGGTSAASKGQLAPPEKEVMPEVDTSNGGSDDYHQVVDELAGDVWKQTLNTNRKWEYIGYVVSKQVEDEHGNAKTIYFRTTSETSKSPIGTKTNPEFYKRLIESGFKLVASIHSHPSVKFSEPNRFSDPDVAFSDFRFGKYDSYVATYMVEKKGKSYKLRILREGGKFYGKPCPGGSKFCEQ